ncbi:MAG: undecaprenyl/decaprenyl-phosphate alpha-N-acetylglucosaminyl 1-phosphate transferase [Clostridia bacterium]|nr:undecaprenyl/decaprenyl-phosphate alpha-N-acetylglucosaminyl 1-phosphate transferase [Clostridia bacterium]
MSLDFVLLRLLFAFVVAFLIAYASTPIVKMLAFRLGAVDVPKDNRRMHKKPIARLGGLAIFYGFIISILCFTEIDTELQGILIGSIIIVVLGIFDDIFSLNAFLKFFVQIGAALVVVMHGVQIDHISSFGIGANPYIPLGVFAVPVTVLWIVGVTNAINLIDGLDGLAAGISIISTVPLFVISLVTGEIGVALVTATIAGAGFGFLPHNIHPAKIFMGDTGSTFLGFTLASISIVGLFKSYAVISMAVPFLILGLPIFDTLFAIIRRVLRGQSPMQPDRGHVHHRLIDLGFDQKQTVIILLIASSLLSLSAVVLCLCGAIRAIILILAVLFLSFLGISLAKKNITNNDELLDFAEEKESEINENEKN